MWNDATATYTSLQANVSRFTCCFSDFPWPASAPDFPTPPEVAAYHSGFTSAFLLDGNCRMELGSEVVLVAPPTPPATQWRVDWRAAAREDAPTQTQLFDFVVVASGFAAVPRMPDIPGLESFPGLVLHSSQYNGPGACAGRRRVAIIGSGHSAVDIAADLAAAGVAAAASGGATEVVHVVPRPFWLIPRYIPSDATSPAPAFLPLDLQLYRRSLRKEEGERLFATPEQRKLANEYFRSICGDQAARLGPCLAVPEDTTDPPVLAISDSYAALAGSGRVRLRRGRLQRVSGASLELSGDGASLDGVDALVLCTGLRPSLPFLHPGLLEKLSYTAHDNYVPLALHRGVFHPDAPGLAFVGVFRGPFFATVELQARLAAAVFSGAIPADGEAAQRAGVEEELRLRAQRPRPVLPHADYVGHADSLAAALGVLPPADWRADPANDVVLAAQYALQAPPPSPLLPPEEATARHAQAAAAVQGTLEQLAAALQGFRSGRCVAGAVFYGLQGEWKLHRTIASRMDSSPSGVVTGTAAFNPTAPPPAPAPAASPAAAAGAAPQLRCGMPLPYCYAEQGQFATDRGGAPWRVRREYEYEYDSLADRLDVYFREGGARGAFFHSLRFLAPGEEPAAPADAAPPVTATGSCPAASPAGLAARVAPAQGGSSSRAAAGDAGTAALPQHGGGAAASGAPGVGTAVRHDGAGSALLAGPGGAVSCSASRGASASQGAAAAASVASCWRAVGEHLCGRDMYYSSYKFSFRGVWLEEFEIQFDVKGPNKDYTATAVYSRP